MLTSSLHDVTNAFAKVRTKFEDSSSQLNKICIADSEITLELGNILDAKVDVIVNPTSSKLTLNWGSLSKNVLSSAGQVIQNECTLKYPTGIDSDQVAITSAGNLTGIKSLFHITCPPFANADTSGKSLSKIITNCLNELSKMNLSSIAIPSIGAGGLGYPANLVAKISLSSIISYLNLNRKKKLNVKIIIYKNDIEIFQVIFFLNSFLKFLMIFLNIFL
jgi:poly [ADP-ribose] polymerase 10/14/15